MFLANNELPLDRKVYPLDVYFGHPKVGLWEKIKKEMPGIGVPVIVIDKPITRKMFDSYIPSRGARILLIPGDTPKEYLSKLLIDISK